MFFEAWFSLGKQGLCAKVAHCVTPAKGCEKMQNIKN